MVQTSSVVVFATVAFGAVSSVIAAPVGQNNAIQPANSAAQGALQQVDATIQSQDTAITQAKDRDAYGDQRKAKQLEAEAKALDSQAGSLDPALVQKKPKDRKRLGGPGSGTTGRARTGTGAAGRPDQGPRRMAAPGTPSRRAIPASAPAPAPVSDSSRRPATYQPGAAPVSDASKATSQVKQPSTAPGQQLFQQQDAQITALQDKFALADQQRAKLLEQQAAALTKQADHLDPALAAPKFNFRAGAATGNGANPQGLPKPAVARTSSIKRRDVVQPAGASGTVASQDKALTTLKDTDATKDASEASSLEAQAQQLTKQADTLDPALRIKKKKGPKRQGGRTGIKEGDRAGMREGGRASGPNQRKGGRGGEQSQAVKQAQSVPAQVARYYFEDDFFGRELFDEEEFYGREWYDLEELD